MKFFKGFRRLRVGETTRPDDWVSAKCNKPTEPPPATNQGWIRYGSETVIKENSGLYYLREVKKP